MGKPKIELNSKQIRAILRSREAQAELLARARRIATNAGPGFKATSRAGLNRASATVTTSTYAARRAEAKDGVLSKSLGAGRG